MRWQQGRLLMTTEVRSWSKEKISRGDKEEHKRVFFNFTGEDQGRSRIFICECADAATAARITRDHNALIELLETLRDEPED